MNTHRRFNSDLPVVLGFAGGYCTGKTSTANGIAPPVRMSMGGNAGSNVPRIIWDHLYFALPLYRMATARQSIEGENAQERMLYEIHATLLDVFGNNPLYGAPNYDDLVDMVYQIAEYPCPKEGKPRTFLQHVGTDILRAYDDDIWVKWMDRKIKEEHRKFMRENRTLEPCCPHKPVRDSSGLALCEGARYNLDAIPPQYGVILSDCRFRNEAQLVAEHPNGILIKFTVSPEVAEQRQFARDGYTMNGQQKNHKSEHQWDSIPDEWYTKTIDTSEMNLKEQIQAVKDLVTELTGVVSA